MRLKQVQRQAQDFPGPGFSMAASTLDYGGPCKVVPNLYGNFADGAG